MLTPFWGEFFGTMVLIILGSGVVAGVLLEKSKAQNAGWVVITAGWAFAVTLGVFTAKTFGSPDAHLNPAVTLAFAIKSGSFDNLPVYFAAQFAGAFVGAMILGMARAFGDYFALKLSLSPAIAEASTVIIMVIVLLTRPQGLFGKKE